MTAGTTRRNNLVGIRATVGSKLFTRDLDTLPVRVACGRGSIPVLMHQIYGWLAPMRAR